MIGGFTMWLGRLEGVEMGHGVNLRVDLAVVVRASKDARQKGVWSV